MIEDRMEKNRTTAVTTLFNGFLMTVICILSVALYKEWQQGTDLTQQLEALKVSSVAELEKVEEQGKKSCKKEYSHLLDTYHKTSRRIFNGLEVCAILHDEENIPTSIEGMRQYSLMERLVASIYLEYYDLYGNEELIKKWSKTGYLF